MNVKSQIICIIVDYGNASKILAEAKKHGIKEATILRGTGIIHNRLLDFLGFIDIRKELIYMIAPTSIAKNALKVIAEKFEFHKPHHGIAFTKNLYSVIGGASLTETQISEEREDSCMYYQISVIVDKGRGQEVVDVAISAGAKGGTIINARGSGVHETSKLFAMQIEPEKEIVIMLVEKPTCDNIVKTISEAIDINSPGKGIMYIQEICETYGLYK